MAVGDSFDLAITDVAFGGKGVGRLREGKACFVPYVISGERVKVRIVKETKRFAGAALAEVIEASARRVTAPCPVFGLCGGCAYQHMEYSIQLEVKREQVRQVLARIGGLGEVNVQPVVPSPKPYGYRNRITVHARGGKIGFHRQDGRGLVDVEQCPIASDEVNARLRAARRGPEWEGPRTLREHEDRFGFHQTNDSVAELLLGAVEGACEEGGARLIDAYCGSGFFARRLAGRYAAVVGIEWNPRSVALARESAGGNETYLEGDVADRLAEAMGAGSGEGVTVILDPPSQGASSEVIDLLAQNPVAKIVYVSCNPATLARDLKNLAAVYRVNEVQPFDMFPQTAEIEVMAVLSVRGESDEGLLTSAATGESLGGES